MSMPMHAPLPSSKSNVIFGLWHKNLRRSISQAYKGTIAMFSSDLKTTHRRESEASDKIRPDSLPKLS